MISYEEFLASKAVVAPERGYGGPLTLNPNLKPHARDIAEWMIRGGDRACFASYGLHKTSIQLEVCNSLLDVITAGRLKLADGINAAALVVCPLGVRREFVKESSARGFSRVPMYVATNEQFWKLFNSGQRLFLTNYERVRDGQLDPSLFAICTLDEASVLRSFGSQTYQEFLPLFANVPFKFVATATPSPNRLKELIHYAGFLGVMDTGQALTRFFKRDSSKAGNLQLHPHKKREFLLWLSTWAVFIDKPSDLGHSDEGYILPEIETFTHRLPADYASAGFDSWGQGRLVPDSTADLSSAAREKRKSLVARVAKTKELIDAGGPDKHWIVWYELEDELHALREAIPELRGITATGMTIEEREQIVEDFAEGRLRILATKPKLSGSGSNFQDFCWSNIFMSLTYKANDFMQARHRTQRFGQTHAVEEHLIYTESEDPVYDEMTRKVREHVTLHSDMAEITREYGLKSDKARIEMQRAIITTRFEVKGDLSTAVNADNVPEMRRLADNSIDLVVTSVPFSDHYEYTETYNDFGHNDGDEGFFAQMEYLTPELMRALKPGRMYCVHAKDRIVYGSVSGDGMYTVNEFSDKCVAHTKRHGFRYCGRITVITDVVRENNQTYRLGWTENSKDGTKMGVGSPEYILLFRKLPSSRAKSYADEPVIHSKEEYPRARWQFDAHSLWRSSGDRFLTAGELSGVKMDALRRAWLKYSRGNVYDFKEHVSIAHEMEQRGILPSEFMALEVANPGAENVWDDITRIRTLNLDQARKGLEGHICPLQLDIVERLIERYSNPGEVVLDPFGGLGTVAQQAILMGRSGYTIELNPDSHRDAVRYCKAAEAKVSSPTLFDFLDAEGRVA